MEHFERKVHWENIYKTRPLNEVSWYQPKPETSLDFIRDLSIKPEEEIIDIGGGDSLLADYLLEMGFKHISVLDISEAALTRAKVRLGRLAAHVEWIEADAAEFSPPRLYDFWHDRAAFHFLTDEKDISKYIETAHRALKPGGTLLIGTFSDLGPTQCSGLEIKQYSEESMTRRFSPYFTKIQCKAIAHQTPRRSIQHFMFCSFRKH